MNRETRAAGYFLDTAYGETCLWGRTGDPNRPDCVVEKSTVSTEVWELLLRGAGLAR